MPRLRKDELRRDRFLEIVSRSVVWIRGHGKHLAISVLALLVLGAAAGGLLVFRARIDKEARTLLAQADDLFRKAISTPISRSDPKAMERIERPIKTYQEVIERFPRSRSAVEAAIRLGNIYYQLERYDKALSMFEDYLNRYPKGRFRFLAGLGVGYSYEEKGELEKASHAYAAALETTSTDPLLPEAYVALARVQASLGRVEDARQVSLKVVEQWPNTGWAEVAKQQLAQVSRMTGDYRR